MEGLIHFLLKFIVAYVFSAEDEFEERTFPHRTQRSVK